MIKEFAKHIPAEFKGISGKVFYSGRAAFSFPSSLYVLGENPGGDPVTHKNETIDLHTTNVLEHIDDEWSAYADESWKGHKPGTFGMAPRILHLFRKLNLQPRQVPSSNLIFVRSKRENDIKAEFARLSERCWPFHEEVIKSCKSKVVLCLGKKTGRFVKMKTGANMHFETFIENNDRKWKTQAFRNSDGMFVVIATHPSVADWTKSQTDPSALIAKCLAELGAM